MELPLINQCLALLGVGNVTKPLSGLSFLYLRRELFKNEIQMGNYQLHEV